MGQIAAALLFAVAAGLGLTVILAMLKSNGSASLSSLAGEGAFAIVTRPAAEPTSEAMPPRRSPARRETARAVRSTSIASPSLSYAA